MNNEFAPMVNHQHHLSFEHRSSRIYPIDPMLNNENLVREFQNQTVVLP